MKNRKCQNVSLTARSPKNVTAVGKFAGEAERGDGDFPWAPERVEIWRIRVAVIARTVEVVNARETHRTG